MIEIQNLCAGYGERLVLRDVSIRFLPGKVTVLLGPNGCGKSTLMKTAIHLLPKKSGSIRLDGTEIEQLTPRQVARKAAYLSQSRSVPSITAGRMVLHGRFPYLSYPRRYRRQDHEAVRRAMEWVGATDLAECMMETLSGGQRQKVYLAMVLAQNADTIFMDEPTTYMDVSHQLEVREVARRLAEQGKAVVLVLHDLNLAMRLADVAVVMKEGRLLQTGTPEEIFAGGILDRAFEVKVQRVQTSGGWQYYWE